MRNEGQSIKRCLASIADQDYPSDSSRSARLRRASRATTRWRSPVLSRQRPAWTVRTNPRRIQAAAWNAGIRAASGEIVGIVSGHAELGPAYVRSAVDALDRMRADIVGGPVRAVAETPIGAAIAIATSTPFGVGGARHHYLTEPAYVDTVFMGVARRETWLRYPFDEEFVRNQDDELSYRLLDAGGRILCDPAIESCYRSRSTLCGPLAPVLRLRLLEGPGPPGASAPGTRPATSSRLPWSRHSVAGAILGVISRKARVGTAWRSACTRLTTAVAAVRYRDRSAPIRLRCWR